MPAGRRSRGGDSPVGVVLWAGDLRVAGETVVLALRGSAECWRFSWVGSVCGQICVYV